MFAEQYEENDTIRILTNLLGCQSVRGLCFASVWKE